MNHDTLIDQYLSGPDLLRRAVAGLTKGQLFAMPIPGKWSSQSCAILQTTSRSTPTA
jgi:hypothetical protein